MSFYLKMTRYVEGGHGGGGPIVEFRSSYKPGIVLCVCNYINCLIGHGTDLGVCILRCSVIL